MKRHTRSAFNVSVSLHVVFLVSLFIVPWLLNLRQEPEELYFELVSMPAEGDVAEEALEQEPVDEPEPEDTSLRLQELEALAELPEIDLERMREPEPEPAPQPAPQTDPEPEPEPQPQRVSYAEWRRDRDLPDQPQQTRTTRRQAPDVPQVDTRVRERLQSAVSDVRYDRSDRASSVTDDEMAAYISSLSQRLQTAFEPTGANLEAEVAFEVQANGRFGQVRIIRGSGHSAFDEAVRRTFQRTRPPGSPPGGRTYTFTLTFRSTGG